MDPLGDGNFYCMQLYRDNHGGGCPGNSLSTCDVSSPVSLRCEHDVLIFETVGSSRARHLRQAPEQLRIQCKQRTKWNKVPSQPNFFLPQMVNYYAAAAQCNHAQLEDNIPDYTTMQADGVTPACYYNINAQKAARTNNCHGKDNLLCDVGFSFSDF